mgnify:CR=1 FL=1
MTEPIDPSQQFHKDTFRSVAECQLLYWKDLGRCLGIKSPVIDNIEEENKNNKYEQCYQMLEEWVKRQGRSARLDILLSKLSTMPEYSDAFEKVVEKITSKVVQKMANKVV